MVAVLENKTDDIAALCRKYNVVGLYAFGSALRDDFRPGESDVDLLVEFAPMDGYDRATAYFDMVDELEAALGTKVDLVMAGAVKNRYISAEIDRTKRMLYPA
ncbi:MAG: nucleotidyltransferase domain-containing protein [Coriobacteriia bacterium]